MGVIPPVTDTGDDNTSLSSRNDNSLPCISKTQLYTDNKWVYDNSNDDDSHISINSKGYGHD